jgi:hypothetical protein
MYFNDSGSIFNTYYDNCLQYFGVECPHKSRNLGSLIIQTTTPFIFITDMCINLINHIKQKENVNFEIFFIESKKYTEFYFYYSYVLYNSKQSLYEYNTSHCPVITIGPQDPQTAYFNSWAYKKHILDTEHICIFSIHRHSIWILDSEYKKSLIEFYTNIYKDTSLLKEVLYFLYK